MRRAITTFTGAALLVVAGSDDSWSGGYGITGPVLADEEFVHLLGPNPVVCSR